MSFEDLPGDWPHRSLADTAFAADVVDLVVADADRQHGAIAFLLCRHDGTLAQPVVVTHEEREPLQPVIDAMVGAPGLVGVGGVVVAVARAWGSVTDTDRWLHQHLLEVCRGAGWNLWGTYLATLAGVTALPVAPELDARRRGVA